MLRHAKRGPPLLYRPVWTEAAPKRTVRLCNSDGGCFSGPDPVAPTRHTNFTKFVMPTARQPTFQKPLMCCSKKGRVAVGTRVTSRRAQIRTCSFPAYGSHLGYPRQLYAAVCEPASLTRLCGATSGACVAGPLSPWSPPFAPPAPQRFAPLCSSASQLLWRSATLVPVHHRLRLLTSPMRTIPRTRH